MTMLTARLNQFIRNTYWYSLFPSKIEFNHPRYIFSLWITALFDLILFLSCDRFHNCLCKNDYIAAYTEQCRNTDFYPAFALSLQRCDNSLVALSWPRKSTLGSRRSEATKCYRTRYTDISLQLISCY